MTILGIHVLTRPRWYLDAKVAATLNVHRATETTPLQVEDDASV